MTTHTLRSGFSRFRRRHPLRSRGLAIAIAAACLIAQLAAAAHEATERHVRCAEHGELAHVRAMSAAPIDLRRAAAWEASDAGGVAAGHDHCAFVVAARRPQGERIIVASTAPPLAPPPAPAPAPTLPPQTDRILLSAPKHAPPRA